MKKPRIQDGTIKYKTKNVRKKSKGLNIGPKNCHARFDSEGNELKAAKPSRMLNRVKDFLNLANTAAITQTSNPDLKKPEPVKKTNREIIDSESRGVDEVENDKQLFKDAIKHEEKRIDIKLKGPSGSVDPEKHIDSDITTVAGANKLVINIEKPCGNRSKMSGGKYETDSLPDPIVGSDTCRVPMKQLNFEDEPIEREAVSYDLDMWTDTTSSNVEGVTETIGGQVRKKGKKKGKKRKGAVTIPVEIAGDPELRKYWGQRYRLFSKFDEGIRMDRGKMCSIKLLE